MIALLCWDDRSVIVNEDIKLFPSIKKCLKYLNNSFSQIMEILLNSGVDVDLADVSGITPLDCAIEKQHTAMVTRLVELGAPIQSTSWNMAVGNQEMIKLLLSELEVLSFFFKTRLEREIQSKNILTFIQ